MNSILDNVDGEEEEEEEDGGDERRRMVVMRGSETREQEIVSVSSSYCL
jgi:hypothetical protein